eukprot:Phypoly_transcript_01364.p1 GENE.Phypoly_transcript_01364~~Phypoly_transcript_01364.p1  ORF type:complete len:1135 (+),score=191.05 Phypoly_transcript_01364:297-3407(+)
MDGEKHNIFKKKDLNLSKFSRIFKKNPVVPLFGDMQITLESTIKRSPHFDEKVWGTSTEDPKIAQEYEILHLLQATRQAHNEYVAKFGNVINELKISRRSATTASYNPAECREITNVVLQGLQLLSDWSSKVLQQSAWKYARPNNDPLVESVVDYERVVKYNYTSEERFALVEFIAMIKGLSGLLMRNEAVLSPIIKIAIHDELQEFVQITLREMIRSVSGKNAKKKTANARSELLQLRALAADWINGVEPQVDSALYGKKSSKEEDKITYPTRAVGPNVTQLNLVRNIVYGLILKKKEFSSSQVKELEEFYGRSFFYKYLVSIVPTVLAMTDLADLWYREFYLELSRRLQFPIEMSLPWILTDHILESRDSAMMEAVLYPLDIYNDAAHRALVKLGTRFLYDEIEAEVNLCFDQLLFKLSEEIFTWFKVQASTILMDKPYRAQLEIVYSTGRFNVPKSRYDVLMRQRHFQLLGRSLDLNNLISQRQNQYLRQNLDYAISRFEASDLTSLVELEHQIVNIQLTHRLMSEHFSGLDPWINMLSESNESTSLASFHGRIVLHIIFELMYDFFPNYNFNSITQRFSKLPPMFLFTDPVQRDAMPKTNIMFLQGNKPLSSAYANSIELTKKFFGLPHIHSLLRLAGREGLPLIISEVLRNMELKIVNVLSPYVKELFVGMPPSSKLPIHDYGTEGGYGYFQLKLKDIFTYPDLRPEVMHNFRIFGNAIVLLNLLDLASAQLQTTTFVQAAPFLGYTMDDMRPNENESPLFTNLQRVAQFLESKPELAKCSTAIQDIVMNAWRADHFYRPPPQNISIFKSVLARIDAMLTPVRAEWLGTPPDNGLIPVDSTSEFYRLWSALQFVVCVPSNSENDMSCHELFGDGLMWAGATIIHFLQQQNRFEAFDFSYHILNVEESAAVPCQKPILRQFFRTVALMRDINQTIFAILNTYAPQPASTITLLHPPATETDQEKQFLTLPEERENSFLRPTITPSSSAYFDVSPPPPPPSMGYEIPPPPLIDFDAPPPPPLDFAPPPPPPPF